MARLKKTEIKLKTFDEMFNETFSDLKGLSSKGWHVIPARRGEDIPFDFLLIKTFKNKITHTVNPDSPNPVALEKILPYQINVGVRLDHDGFETNLSSSYVSLSIFAKNFAMIKTGLDEIERLHG